MGQSIGGVVASNRQYGEYYVSTYFLKAKIYYLPIELLFNRICFLFVFFLPGVFFVCLFGDGKTMFKAYS